MCSKFPLEGKYTVFDLEIPNLYNDSLCAISMIVIEDGQELIRHTELINPCSFFSAQNIKIHHITQSDVADKRTFSQFWDEYGRYFEDDYVLIAHNVMSDVSVLCKELLRLGKKLKATKSLDTMDILSAYLKDKPKQKGDMRLNNACRRFGIYIDHHNPESDANACIEIIRFLDRYHNFDCASYIRDIPEKEYTLSLNKHKPTPVEVRPYLRQLKRRMQSHEEPFCQSLKQLEKLGHHAYYSHDTFGIMTYYEGAIACDSLDTSVYLRLAVLYRSLGIRNESERVLKTGISLLESKGRSASVLKNYQTSRSRRTIRRSTKPQKKPSRS